MTLTDAVSSPGVKVTVAGVTLAVTKPLYVNTAASKTPRLVPDTLKELNEASDDSTACGDWSTTTVYTRVSRPSLTVTEITFSPDSNDT